MRVQCRLTTQQHTPGNHRTADPPPSGQPFFICTLTSNIKSGNREEPARSRITTPPLAYWARRLHHSKTQEESQKKRRNNVFQRFFRELFLRFREGATETAAYAAADPVVAECAGTCSFSSVAAGTRIAAVLRKWPTSARATPSTAQPARVSHCWVMSAFGK
jgi:hypothetical protein